MATNKKFFDDLLLDRGMSLRALAKQIDILPSQLSRTFTGKRRMQIDEAVRIGKILGASLHEVALNAGIEAANSKINRVAVIGFMDGQGEVKGLPSGVIETTSMPDGLPEDTVAVQCRTAGTALSWLDGWLYFIDRNHDAPEMSMLGRFVLAQVTEGVQVMGTLRRGYESGTFGLDGPVSLESQRLDWVSAVRLIRP